MTRSKVEWRRDLLSARRSLSEEARRSASAAIAKRLQRLRCLREASTLFGYLALGAEPDPSPVLASAHENGVPVFVPATTDWSNDVSWVALFSGEGRRPVAHSRTGPLVALVPGLGFDRLGVRLGRGAGFFDRALERLRAAGPALIVGVAFDVQVVPALPHDSWDQPMDIVVSEQEMFGASVSGADALEA